MKIGGFQRFSLCDYPGEAAAIIFTLGCNYRCRYCHNPELVLPERFAEEIPLDGIMAFLERRRGQLKAVTITGGEPTLQADLLDVMRAIKGLGYLVKLDTNGSRPSVLAAVLKEGLADYVAMDVKAPLDRYGKVTACQPREERLKESVSLILRCGLRHEFRTTVAKGVTSHDDLRGIAKAVSGAERFFIQKFVPTKHVNATMGTAESYSDSELNMLAREFSSQVQFCGVR